MEPEYMTGRRHERDDIESWIRRNVARSSNTAWVECAEFILLQIELGAHRPLVEGGPKDS